MKDPSVTDSKQKAAFMLGKALKAGVQKGRLMFAKHQPKNGGKNYRLVTKPNRRKVLAKWTRHKKSVEYKDVDDFGKVSVRSLVSKAREEQSNLLLRELQTRSTRRSWPLHAHMSAAPVFRSPR